MRSARIWLVALGLTCLVSSSSQAAQCHWGTTIERDGQGVWSIKSASPVDAFDAMGYAVAQDRLWQAELYRRSGRGTLAELFGPSQLPTDVLLRTIGYSEEELQAGFDALDPLSKLVLRAYVNGFNRRIAEVRDNPLLLPFEFATVGNMIGVGPLFPADWTVTDVLAWSVVLMRSFDSDAMQSGQLENARLLQELTAKFPQEAFAMFSDLRWLNDTNALTMIPKGHGRASSPMPHRCLWNGPNVRDAARSVRAHERAVRENLERVNARVKLGSYAWVVSGRKTQSRRPILYSGPQMGFTVPAPVVEGSIETPLLKVSGAAIPGIPGLIVGRTPDHAWSMQVGHAHTVDCYLEAPESVYVHRIETIKVAGEGDVTLPVFRTIHGPVIYPMPYDSSQPTDVIVSWKYAHWGFEFDVIPCLLGLATTHSVAAFGAAVGRLPVSAHVCYANRRGDIAYWMSGRDPIRPENTDPRLPLLGDGSQEWPYPILLKPRPFACNPAQGYFGGWNTKSCASYDNNNNVELAYGPFQRGNVIDQYLAAKNNLTFEEVRDLAIRVAATDSFSSSS